MLAGQGIFLLIFRVRFIFLLGFSTLTDTIEILNLGHQLIHAGINLQARGFFTSHLQMDQGFSEIFSKLDGILFSEDDLAIGFIFSDGKDFVESIGLKRFYIPIGSAVLMRCNIIIHPP